MRTALRPTIGRRASHLELRLRSAILPMAAVALRPTYLVVGRSVEYRPSSPVHRLTLTISADRAGVGNTGQRPNVTGPCDLSPWQYQQLLLDERALRQPAFGAFGNLGLNTIRQPGLNSTQFNLSKKATFHITATPCYSEVRRRIFQSLQSSCLQWSRNNRWRAALRKDYFCTRSTQHRFQVEVFFLNTAKAKLVTDSRSFRKCPGSNINKYTSHGPLAKRQRGATFCKHRLRLLVLQRLRQVATALAGAQTQTETSKSRLLSWRRAAC